MTQIVDGKLVENVKESIKEEKRDFLVKLIDEMRPADLADLMEHLNSDERLYFFEFMEPKGAGDVLVEIEAPVQESILDDLDNEAISEIVQELDSDDAADLVGDLPAERAKQIIETVEDEVSEDLEKLLPYPDDTAGGIMALEFVAVKAGDTIQQAIDTIRKKREEVQNIYYLFVVDDFNRLAGVISLKDLVLEPRLRRVQEIMDPEVISVDVNTDQEEVYIFTKGRGSMEVYADEQSKTFVHSVDTLDAATIPLLNYHPVYSQEQPLHFIWCLAGARYWIGDKHQEFMSASVDSLTT